MLSLGVWISATVSLCSNKADCVLVCSYVFISASVMSLERCWKEVSVNVYVPFQISQNIQITKSEITGTTISICLRVYILRRSPERTSTIIVMCQNNYFQDLPIKALKYKKDHMALLNIKQNKQKKMFT